MASQSKVWFCQVCQTLLTLSLKKCYSSSTTMLPSKKRSQCFNFFFFFLFLHWKRFLNQYTQENLSLLVMSKWSAWLCRLVQNRLTSTNLLRKLFILHIEHEQQQTHNSWWGFYNRDWTFIWTFIELATFRIIRFLMTSGVRRHAWNCLSNDILWQLLSWKAWLS